ncbi:MAG: PAS domain S-box protein [Synechococcales cyanobacterium K44_A2020_017]|nr:PAS domain S-box protein [Synechococcales cyanobacterium K32_A2020_035]MBF2095383.1 PAS domain S-box protein [Synechococcales cyanobacterium K44_A2020_017]
MQSQSTCMAQPDWQVAMVRHPLVMDVTTPLVEAIAAMGASDCNTSVPSTLSVAEQIQLEIRSSCVLVVAHEQLVGLLTDRDIVRLRHREIDWETLTLGETMTPPVDVVRAAATDTRSVLDLLSRYPILYLPVVDEGDRPVGWLTQATLLPILSPLDLYQHTIQLQETVDQLKADKQALEQSRTLNPEQQVAERIPTLVAPTNCEKSLTTIANQIRSSLDLQQILDTTVQEVRSLLQCDRVIIYQLYPDLNGCVIAEALTGHDPSILHNTTYDPCISSEWLEFFRLGNVRLVNDIYEVGMTTCHQEMLEALDIRAKLMVPIVVDQQLWGFMLASYRDRPYAWQPDEVLIVQQLSIQVAIALQQATAYQQAQIELEERKKAEAALRQSEQRFRAIFDNMFQFIGLLSPDGILLEANQTALNVGNIQQADVVGRPFWDADWWQISAEIQTQLKEAIARAAQGEFVRYEVDIWGANQTVIPIDFSLRPIMDETGQVSLLIPEGRDLRESKQVEAQRQRALDSLLKSEQRYASLTAAVPVGIFRTDVKGNCLYINQHWCDLTGLSPKEAMNGEWDKILHPDDREHVLTAWEEARQTQQPFQCEYRYLRADGTVCWIYEQTIPERDEAGQVTSYIGTNTDISDRKRMELTLAASEAQHRAVLAAIPDLMFRVGADGRYRGFITQRSELNILSSELSFTGQKIGDVLPQELASQKMYYLQQALQTGELQIYEQDVQVGDRIQQEEVRIVKSGDDEVLFMIRDISDRKQAEAERLQAEKVRHELRLLENILDIVLAGYWDWDLSTDLEYLSPGFKRMLGYDDHELPNVPASWQGLIFPEDLPRVDECFERHVQSQGKIPYYNEVRYRHKNGSTVWVICSGQVIAWDAAGTPLRMIGCHIDISDRKQYETQLQQTNLELARATRLKDEFLANMSHELRTPLNAILGMTEGLQEEIFGPINAQQRHALETVERSSQHLLSLINDILDLAKIESGQVELHHAPTVISTLCSSSLAFVNQQAFKKSIQIQVQIPSTLPMLLMDERRICQVLINLLNNAVKFTPDGGTITLAVSHERSPLDTTSSHIRFSVSDTGIGIAAEDLSKLFQPFTQIDSSLSRQFEGTGLGLSLVKRIVDLHGGAVEVTSTLGSGSCFSFTLPCLGVALPDAQPNGDLSSSSGAAQAANASEPLILIAEDNPDNIMTLDSYLEAKGYRLVTAQNGQEAIALTQSLRPALILMDIQMPVMDGLDAIRYIRQQSDYAEVPIIALTALAMAGDRDRCLEAGANDYMTKPIHLKQLVAMIQSLLQNRSET